MQLFSIIHRNFSSEKVIEKTANKTNFNNYKLILKNGYAVN